MNSQNSKIIPVIRQKWPILALLVAILAVAPFLAASSHKNKIYVDAKASETETGSSEHPFKTIKKALDQAGKKTEIYVAKGKYRENITIKEEVDIFGTSADGVIIEAKDDDKPVVIMKHDTTLNKVTVKNGKNGIKVDNGAKASIIKVTVKNNNRDGIYIAEGSVKDKKMVSISECEITGNGWAGIYSNTRRLSIVDNDILENGSEGIDIESGSSAWIAGNRIKDNRGSGMKLRIDGSNIWTKNNSIRENKKEGIDISFRGHAGRINIAKSKIIGNHRYGVAKIQRFPRAADSTSLWNKYLTFDNKNELRDNRSDSIASTVFIFN
jgi:nitrous oxidase accessory protein NosD